MINSNKNISINDYYLVDMKRAFCSESL